MDDFTLWLTDSTLKPIKLIENYESIIWTERYSEAGDFELYSADITGLLPYVKFLIDAAVSGTGFNDEKTDYSGAEETLFIKKSNTKTVMIVEKIRITTDVEEGSYITLSGRSTEALLERRIVAAYEFGARSEESGQITTLCPPWKYIERLLNSYYFGMLWNIEEPVKGRFVTPTDERIIFNESYPDAVWNNSPGDNLYDAIQNLCYNCGYGFKMVPTYDASTDDLSLEFKLYLGEDKSDAVTFSPRFDNLINSDFSVDLTTMRNSILLLNGVRGASHNDGETITAGTFDYIYKPNQKRHSSKTAIGVRRMYADVSQMLEVREREQLYEGWVYMAYAQQALNSVWNAQVEFSGQAETSVGTFQLGVDYSLGDIVMVENEFGLSGKTQIVEIVEAFDKSNGHQLYPTFSAFSPWNIIINR